MGSPFIAVGKPLYGYCGGAFGRDSYRDKRIEAFGVDWIVAREEYGEVVFAEFQSEEAMRRFVAEFSTKPPEDDDGQG